MKKTIILEGITVQHAAELLLDIEFTRNERKLCKYTYLRCLEDFAQAIIFSDQIAIGRNLPKVGDRYPGKEILETIFELNSSKIVWLDKPDSDPGDLLKDPTDRIIISSWINHLGSAITLYQEAWKQHVIREAKNYAGTDKKLCMNLDDQSEYEFKDKRFWHDENLENQISNTFIDILLKYMPEKLENNMVFSLSARKEFIKRSTLAHILIWHWYHKSIVNSALTNDEHNNLPHITRASLTYKIEKDKKEKNKEAWEMLMPRFLAGIMKNKNITRENLLIELINFSATNKETKDIKSIFFEAIEEYKNGNDSKILKLTHDLEKYAEKTEHTEIVETTISGKLTGIVPGIASSIKSSKTEIVQDYNYYNDLRILIRHPGKYDLYEHEALRIFPELR